MKKSLRIAAITLSLMLLAACQAVTANAAEQKDTSLMHPTVITGKSYKNEYTEENYTSLIEFEYAGAFLEDADEAKYPALKASLDEYNAKRCEQVEGDIEGWRTDAIAMYEDMPEYFSAFFEKYTLLPMRVDSQVVSFSEPWSSYSGGAHGMYGRCGWNYDTQTGTLLTLKDISPDPKALLARLKELIEEKYPDLSFMSESTLFEGEAEDMDPYFSDYSYVLTHEGLDFFVGPYLLGSYAEGAQNVLLPYKGNEDLFFEKYLVSEGTYTQPLLEREMSLLDVDNDGDYEEVQIIPDQDEYYNYRTMHVYIDGKDYSEECYCFGFTPLFVHGEDGNYLYVEQDLENDYKKLYLYQISADGISPIKDLECGFYHPYGKENYSCTEIITDPDSFLLASRTDALSTSSIYRRYHLGEGGLPVPDEEMWTIIMGRELTLKKELTADIVDENGEVLEKAVTFAPGDVLTTLRTDDKEKIDLRAADGRIVRVYLDMSSWPMTIDGTDIEEIFDGMMYAG